MRIFTALTDATAYNYLHQQCSEVGDAVRTNFSDYDSDVFKQFPHVYFSACTIRRGIEKGVPQPPQYLRAWATFDGMRVEEKDGKHYLKFPRLGEGTIELLDYEPPEDGTAEFLAIVRPVEDKQWEVVFYQRGEYRHRDLARAEAAKLAPPEDEETRRIRQMVFGRRA